MAANLNGISLTPAEAAALPFDPTAGFTGLAAFKYTAVDNSGFAKQCFHLYTSGIWYW
ncbi:MAG: hypothetical protein IPO68_00010 [Chitinophagaceae bacterium]|nr:hypothetical protein [Chitinophagaceae bacterium]